jgi:diguanylate cyclase (GGDEF)-like protein
LASKLSVILNRLQVTNFYWRIGFYGLVLAGFFHALFIPLFLWLGIPVLAAVNVLSVAIYWYCIFGLGLPTLESGDDSTIGWLVYIELIGHNLLATYYLGPDAGFQYYIYVLAVLPFFVFTYSFTVYALRIAFVIIVSLLIDTHSLFRTPVVHIDPSLLQLLHHFNLFVFLSVLSLLSYLYAVHARTHHDTLERGAVRDHLTGLYNRRHIETLVESFGRDKSQWPSPGLLLVDIDHFKRLNDTYGHACGDVAIVTVANLLAQDGFGADAVARWGGEEFLLLYRNIDEVSLHDRAERIRKAVSEEPIRWDGLEIFITITVGGTVAAGEESFNEALHRADMALYEGKKGGRNRVTLLHPL